MTEPDLAAPAAQTPTPPAQTPTPEAQDAAEGPTPTVADPAAPATPAARKPPLLRERDFRLFLFGEGVSSIGDGVTLTALPLLVLLVSGSGLAMGIVGALQVLPDLLLGLPAGALADRWDRRRMMLWADIGRAILAGLIPLAWFVAGPQATLVTVLLVAFPIAALRVVFLAGYTGALPNLVGRDRLAEANGFMEAVFGIGFLLGPAMAGVLVATLGPAPTIAIDALSFLVSAVALSRIRRVLRAPEQERRHLLIEIREGIAFLARHRVLRSLVAFWGAIGVVLAPLIAALAYYLTEDRGFGPEVFGVVISAYAAGSIAGALWATRLGRHGMGMRMILGNIVSGAVLLTFAVVESVPPILIGGFITGVAFGMTLNSYVTLRASLTPDELLGRVGATARTISIGLQPAGMVIGGLLLEVAAGRGTLIVMGAATLVISLIFGLSRSVREAGHHAAHAGGAAGH